MFRLAIKLSSWVRSLLWNTKSPLPSDENSVLEEDGGAKRLPQNVEISDNVFGIVTSVHTDYVLVDEHIYCNMKNILGVQIPRKGDRVRVSVVQSRNAGSTECCTVIAQSLHITTDNWDDDGPQGLPSADPNQHENYPYSKIGKVTCIERNCVVVDDDFKFIVKKSQYRGFVPMVGDWISVNVVENQDECKDGSSLPVFDIKPLRSRTTDGTISWKQLNYGAINDEIYFHPGACINGYRPRVGDQVRVSSIESTRGKYEWRAVSIVPKMAREPQWTSRDVNNTSRQALRPIAPAVAPINGPGPNHSNGISVTPEHELLFDGIVYENEMYQTIWIRNRGRKTVTLFSNKLADDAQKIFELSKPVIFEGDEEDAGTSYHMESLPLAIPSGHTVSVNVVCHPIQLGLYRSRVCFEFDEVFVWRNLKVNVSHPMMEECARKARENPGSRNNRDIRRHNIALLPDEDVDVISGVQPLRSGRSRPVIYMQKYPVPQYLKDIIAKDTEPMDVLPYLAEDLSLKNHEEKFSTLLFLEEIQLAINLADHDIQDAYFSKRGEFLALEVLGLVDGALSLMMGDRVLAKDPRDVRGPTYEGCIHDVLGETIFLKFCPQFHDDFNGQVYHVRFQHCRISFRRMHQALKLSEMFAENVLFPKHLTDTQPKVEIFPLGDSCAHCVEGAQNPRGPLSKFCACQCHGDFAVSSCGGLDTYRGDAGGRAVRWFNRALNARQKVAVHRILEGRSSPIPYVLFGPPGTGKTVTVVEAILQVLHLMSDSRVLVCAPSNSAADLLCERLHNSKAMSTSDMIRLNALYRTENSLSEAVKLYSTYGMAIETKIRYRVIVATCNTVGILFNMGLKLNHITHVFVDEAGQAAEPECLIPMCLAVGNKDAVLVLSGDPYQLGPVIQSRVAATYGLQVSLLERLVQSSLYTRDHAYEDKYNPHVVTRLVQNYRSHPSILHISSSLFYNCELEACAKENDRECLCGWDGLLTQGFPIVFLATMGEELRESDCPSWFNPAEVMTVLFQATALYEHGLVPEDLGIITPYRKQVEKIRMMMNSCNVPLPKIGSVEEFQGQERKVILVSTVRSCVETATRGAKIGFVGNPKRFNVIMSRAKALLIVVGDPFLLVQDKYWAKFIKYCLDHNAVKGCNVEELRTKADAK